MRGEGVPEVISLSELRKKKQCDKVYDRELLDALDHGWKCGMITDVIVVATMTDGRVGVMGNGVPRDKAVNMMRRTMRRLPEIVD